MFQQRYDAAFAILWGNWGGKYLEIDQRRDSRVVGGQRDASFNGRFLRSVAKASQQRTKFFRTWLGDYTA
jgi:hypothetical protein